LISALSAPITRSHSRRWRRPHMCRRTRRRARDGSL
jgi:hypothetical protein